MVKLTVVLREGRDLLAADLNGKSDPYCILKLRSGGPALHSKVIPKTLNPKWNDTFFFDTIDPRTDVLTIECFDKDAFSKDDPLGSVEIPLAQVPRVFGSQVTQIPPQWVTLQHVKKGQIELSMYFDDGAAPRPYQVHYNTLAGGLTMETGDKFSDYATYEIGLFGVVAIFGNAYQHWNIKYDKANQIFGPGPSAALARKAINLQHAELYREGKWRTKRGNIENGDDFLKLVNYGVRNGRRRMFTYALLDNVFRFSETSTSTMKDIMSKHATHANAAPEVRYSGEFHIRQTSMSPPAYMLVIDNNSGTYAPDKNMLPKLQQVFVTNFPGLAVEAIDHDDPRLAQYKQEMTQSVTSPSMSQDAYYYPQPQPGQPQQGMGRLPGSDSFAYPLPNVIEPPPQSQFGTFSNMFGPNTPFAAQSISLPSDVGPLVTQAPPSKAGLPDPYLMQAPQPPLQNMPPPLLPPLDFIPSFPSQQFQPGAYPQVPSDFIPNAAVSPMPPPMQYPQGAQPQYPLNR